MIEDLGRKTISDLKLYSDYLKWDEDKQRYETWEEAVDDVLNTHVAKYGDKVIPLINKVRPFYKKKKFLVSQRNLQFRTKQILQHEPRMYNCSVTYAYTPDIFEKAFYVLLCGCGLGANLKRKYVKQLPRLHARNKGTQTFIVPDSIEGWAEANKVLLSSYCKHPSLYEKYYGYNIRFDLSLIRVKGAMLSGGFKAPGPEGLKSSLEKIEALIEYHLKQSDTHTTEFKSIIVYDILMHTADAVLSGGVRRSAMNILMDADDDELVNAKTGNWRQTNPQRARSNNSVGLLQGSFSKAEFKKLLEMNKGDNDVGFVFLKHEDEMFNPCFEIAFNFYDQITNRDEAVFQFCNLCEINASECVDEGGAFDAKEFYRICTAAAIAGTLQAGYTNFPYLNKQTEDIVKGEALLGISITGWAMQPALFNKEILEEGARLIKITNAKVAEIIGTNTAARTTCVKPAGNSSVILGTASGIHAEHSYRYFRIMQLNKESEVAKFLLENYPKVLEESVWSAANSDYVVYMPVENDKNVLVKKDLKGVDHLKLIQLVQNSWVSKGKNIDRCYKPDTNHNVSNTVIIDNMDDITDYLYKNQHYFTAVSFVSEFGDKDYNQAPFTSVLTTQELVNTYGDGVIFTSGLVVDGLHYFPNLWEATDILIGKINEVIGTREQVILKKDWLRRARKFAKNYFKGDMQQMVYCMKDVHLWHKWNTINKILKPIDLGAILTQPKYTSIDETGAIACSGNQCEIT